MSIMEIYMYVLSQLWKKIMLFFLRTYIPISGQKQNKGYYFCIPDKISNQLRQTSRGFQPRELHTYAESESEEEEEENRRIEIKNTSSFHLPSGLHFIMSRDSRHLKSSLPQFSVK